MINRRNAFTLIELLVVIAIIAILAAILFPVFAQAKLAAKKTADLSNMKNIDTAVIMYAADSDDTLPVTNWPHWYVNAARVFPYTKNRDIFRNPASSFREGTVQRKQGRNPFGNFMIDPASPCVGLGVSVRGQANLFDDIYPPLDYEWNSWIQNGGRQCANGDWHEVPRSMTDPVFVNVARVVMWVDFPVAGTYWPGGCVDGVCGNGASLGGSSSSYWGANFRGWFGNGSNVAHLDGHAKFYPTRQLVPTLQEWENGVESRTWRGWGLSYGDPSVQ